VQKTHCVLSHYVRLCLLSFLLFDVSLCSRAFLCCVHRGDEHGPANNNNNNNAYSNRKTSSFDAVVPDHLLQRVTTSLVSCRNTSDCDARRIETCRQWSSPAHAVTWTARKRFQEVDLGGAGIRRVCCFIARRDPAKKPVDPKHNRELQKLQINHVWNGISVTSH